MDPQEVIALQHWVQNNADAFLTGTAPGRVDDAFKSKAVRFRWFDVTIGALPDTYLVGMNVHYGGSFGAVWIKNTKTDESTELHPKKPPQHKLALTTAQALKANLLNGSAKEKALGAKI